MADKLIRANGNIVINDDRSSSTSNDRWDIGDVRASLLTRTQFQARNGTDWELLDGTDVSGSALDTLVTLGSGSGLLPNATGKFMRMDDGGQDAQDLADTVAGTTQAQSTNTTGITASVANHTHGDSISANQSSHYHETMRQASSNSGTGTYEWFAAENHIDPYDYDMASINSSPNSGRTSTTDPGITISGGVSSDGSHSASLAGGATETRPANITVNYFVKIN